jgi:hypothetical protein
LSVGIPILYKPDLGSEVLKESCRFLSILLFILFLSLLSGCASKQRSPESEAARSESISRTIELHERWAAEYEEIGSQEMAQYHRELADKERARNPSTISDPIGLIVDVLFDSLLD